MIKEAIAKIVEGKNLDSREAGEAMEEIMSGKATDAQIAGFLAALRMKGETVDEITSFAKVMRQKAGKINFDGSAEMIVDTCGTGGDNSGTFNISTAAAFVLAGAGLKVAKHGNRSISSKCGSADVLEALGIDLKTASKNAAECISKIGIGFLYAPMLHNAMKYALNTRKELGIRTVFNILGPLTNPAGAKVQIVGVFDPNLTEDLAYVLKNLGLKSALVVHGSGLDEITTTGRTKISELSGGKVKNYHINPEDFGFSQNKISEIQAKTIRENADSLLYVLEGGNGAKRNIVLMNAGAAIYIAGKASDINEGIEIAKESVDSGRALEKLNLLRDFNGHS